MNKGTKDMDIGTGMEGQRQRQKDRETGTGTWTEGQGHMDRRTGQRVSLNFQSLHLSYPTFIGCGGRKEGEKASRTREPGVDCCCCVCVCTVLEKFLQSCETGTVYVGLQVLKCVML